MKIFITGGTGFIGTALIKILAQTEHELHCLARKTSNTEHLRDAGAKIFTGEVTDREILLQGMDGCDWVVHMASSFEFWISDKSVFEHVNITGTRLVMESALAKDISKVVHVSTAGIFGNARWPVTEESEPGNERASKYVATKYEGDLIAWDLFREEKLPLVVIYPTAVLGEGDPKAAGRYVRNIAQGRMPAQVLTDAYFSFVYVKDVATAILKALEKDGNIGEKYIISAENHTWGEINKMIAEISGNKLPFIKLPTGMTMFTAYILTGVANLIKRPPLWDMSADQMKLMSQGFKVEGHKAEKELGIKYTSVKNALEQAIRSPA